MKHETHLLQKFHFPIEVVLNSLHTEGPGTSFQAVVFVEFFGEIIYFEI